MSIEDFTLVEAGNTYSEYRCKTCGILYTLHMEDGEEDLVCTVCYELKEKEYVEKFKEEVSKMNVERLLLEVLSNPEYLIDGVYEEFDIAIQKRATELGIFAKGVV